MKTHLQWQANLEAGLPGWRIACVHSCESTMNLARETLNGEFVPSLALAVEQTAGRGRQGRSWLSAERALTATYAFPVTKPGTAVSSFTLVVATVLCRILEDLGYEAGLKWPNDVLLQSERKVCGILAELVTDNGTDFVLIGIGINLAGEPDPGDLGNSRPISLKTISGIDHDVVEIAVLLGRSLNEAWQVFLEKGLAPFHNAWMRRALHIGRQYTVDTGNEKVTGRFEGISREGYLVLVEHSGRVREIVSGHILVIN